MKKNKYKPSKREIYLIIASLSLSLILLGALFNFIAVTENDCKMPVLTSDYVYATNTHFSFKNKDEVNNFYLTDIIPIRMGGIKGKASMGDFLLFLGIISLIIFKSLYLISFIKDKKQKNEKKRKRV